MSRVYLYLVYESYFRYKNYDKFYEINLTTSQVDIKEKYLDKDKYILQFFEVMSEYASKVLTYIQDKYVKSSFPINVKSGELQATCSEFIHKCNSLLQEKMRDNLSQSLAPMITPQLQHKAIAMVKHKETGQVTVVCNNEQLTPADFIDQLVRCLLLHVCQHAIMLSTQVDTIISAFMADFQCVKTSNTELGLTWYKTTEQEITQWLSVKNINTPSILPLTPPLNTDELIVSDSLPQLFPFDDNTGNNKKRKRV